MSIFDWLAAILVIVTMIYLSFVLTLRDWFAALRKGEAVTLLPERRWTSWPLWTQAAIMIIGLAIAVPFFYFLWIPVVRLPESSARVLGAVGLVLYCLGLVLVLISRRTLGKYWGVSTSSQVKLLADHQLIEAGPYSLIRHPMYLGAWTLFLGLALLYPVWAMLLMFVFGVISFANRIRVEEAALAERFGDEWIEYKRRTKLLVPFIW